MSDKIGSQLGVFWSQKATKLGGTWSFFASKSDKIGRQMVVFLVSKSDKIGRQLVVFWSQKATNWSPIGLTTVSISYKIRRQKVLNRSLKATNYVAKRSLKGLEKLQKLGLKFVSSSATNSDKT